MNPGLFFFEVLDKEPGLPLIWGIFLLIGIAGFFSSRVSSLFVPISIFITLLFASMFLSEFHDPNINKSIWFEDPTYMPQTYLAIIISLLLPIIGTIWNLLSKRKKFK